MPDPHTRHVAHLLHNACMRHVVYEGGRVRCVGVREGRGASETKRNQPFGWFLPGRTAVPHGKPQRRGVGGAT